MRRKFDKSRKVQFLHILWHPDEKFLPRFVKMINEEKFFSSLMIMLLSHHIKMCTICYQDTQIYSTMKI